MAPFVRILPLLLAACSKNLFQVCLSPGCAADGAQETLDKLQALAPPEVEICAGTCESLCGSGPVVSFHGQDNKKVIHKRVSGKALLDLLLSQYPIHPSLLDGYELVAQAKQYFLKKDYLKAILLYEQGIQLALVPSKERFQDDKTRDGMRWLVRAYAQEAEARLSVAHFKGALASAQAACDLSNHVDSYSLEVLANICQVCKDARGELEALQSLFALPQDPNIPRDVTNRRRTLGFRLQKLERELGATKS